MALTLAAPLLARSLGLKRHYGSSLACRCRFVCSSYKDDPLLRSPPYRRLQLPAPTVVQKNTTDSRGELNPLILT